MQYIQLVSCHRKRKFPSTKLQFPFSAFTLLAGRQEGHPSCKKAGYWFLVVAIWLELCTPYSSSCHHHLHHPWLQQNPEWRHSSTSINLAGVVLENGRWTSVVIVVENWRNYGITNTINYFQNTSTRCGRVTTETVSRLLALVESDDWPLLDTIIAGCADFLQSANL